MFCGLCKLRLRSSIPSFQLCRNYQQTQRSLKTLPGLPETQTESAIIRKPRKPKGHRKKTALPRPVGDRSRLNIVNEELCDSVIERLTPSLLKHANCDIIDINPGIGLWSSKLHDALKPRTHILMEPDTDRYISYLKPLLDKKDSTYKLIPESGILWDNLKKLESENYLPHQTRYPMGDARLEQPNDTLLFIANLGYYPTRTYQGFTSITGLMVHQLLSAARTHSLFQGYGLVRMFVWMQDKEKTVTLPRVISHRTKTGVEAEITCEKISEIVGSDNLHFPARREHSIDLESARIVQQKMRDAEVQTPNTRVSKLQREVAQITRTTATGSDSRVFRGFLKELDEMEARFARGEFPSHTSSEGTPLYLKDGEDPPGREFKKTPEWQKLLLLRYRRNDEHSKAAKFDRWFSEYESIVSERSKLNGVKSANRKKKTEKLNQRLTVWEDELERNGRLANIFWIRWDDRMAFRQEPPVLLWDRRDSEPLTVSPKDFSPEHEMCLLDFQPKPLWPAMQGKKISNYDYFEILMAGLFMMPKCSIMRGLKHLAPGAAEWIIPRCPSITKAKNGQFLDLDRFPIRTLNQQMLREIFEAWMDWPFRPTKAEMVVRMGNRNSPIEDDEEMANRFPKN